MTFTELITLINLWIKTNGNREITADVLNPVLQAIAEWARGTTGDLVNLNTTDKSNLVAAINEVNTNLANIDLNVSNVYSGLPNPNDTPPPSYESGDFYRQVDAFNVPVALFLYDGIVWQNVTGFLSLPQDILDALNGANSPSASNVFATMADIGGSTPNLQQVVDVDNRLTDTSIISQSSTVDRNTEYADNGVVLTNNDTQTTSFLTDTNVGISSPAGEILLFSDKIQFSDTATGYTSKIKFETPSNLGGDFYVKPETGTDEQFAFVSDIPAPLGFTPEDVANKTDTMAGNTASSTKYLSAKGVYDYIVSLAYLTIASASATYQTLASFASDVRATVLTGFTGVAGTVTSSDSILSAFNKIVGNLALKVDKNRYVFQGKTSITGVTGENVIFTMKIDANTYGSSDAFNFYMTPLKSVTASNIEYRTYIGTSAGALTKQIGRAIANTTTLTFDYKRLYHLDSGLLDCAVGFTTNATTGYNQATAVNSPLATAVTSADLWITVTGNPTVSTEVIGVMDASINPLK